MLRKNNAARIQQTLTGVETMTRFALAVLALASGVYTYLGVRGLLDGTATFVFFAAIIYSAAVSVAIYAFWTFMLRFVPIVTSGAQRAGLFLTMAIGCLMIMAMSAWLNAAALAGSAALEQHLAVTLQGYVQDLDDAHGNALAAQSLLPDVQRAAERFGRLADDERSSGALTGTTGSGSVVQLLTQMSAQMNELAGTITNSRGDVQALFDQGSAHLANMRELVSGAGEVAPRADEFAAEVVQLNGIIASLQETGVAPSVKRAAADLAVGFIAPVADGGTTDLVNRQDTVMGTVRESVAAQSAALTQAADEILSQPKVEPTRFVPLSSAEAVLRYWTDFIPSWAGAMSIDLLPVVLVLVLMIAHDAMRRETAGVDESDSMTAGELLRAMDLYRQLSGKPLVEPGAAAAVVAEPAAPPEETVPPVEVTPATTAAVVVEPEKLASTPSGTDATVTALDVTRKRT
jgi:hypothetical protein